MSEPTDRDLEATPAPDVTPAPAAARRAARFGATTVHRTQEGGRAPGPGCGRGYHLRVLGSSRTVALGERPCSIGTARDNTLVLDDPFVSKRHCSLACDGRSAWVYDRGSRNGTWVNDVRVDRCEVAAGARIVVGRTALQLVGEALGPASLGLIGEHTSMRQVFAQIERLAGCEQPVLIQGETGTGKELVARALHARGRSRGGPFEPLNCGAIPRELAESELFGHAQGAFTGAARERRGVFERADGGTLFLDEIGEMPLELQAKLLRVLEDGVVQPIGDDRRVPVTVRVVAATNRDLRREAERGRFRLDLYYRLAAEVIRLPPLRDRREDIPLLVQHFLALERGEREAPTLDGEILRKLTLHHWSGNVRELRHVVRHLADCCSETQAPSSEALAELLEAAPPLRSDDGLVQAVGRDMQAIRRDIYLANLRACAGNRSAAAAALGIPKSTFFDHLRELGVRGGDG